MPEGFVAGNEMHRQTVPTNGPAATGDSAATDGWKTSNLKGYPIAIWPLLVGSSLVRAAGFAYPFLAFHVAGRGHGPGTVGAVLAAFGVGWGIGQLLSGWLVDRFGVRSSLVVTMLFAAVMLMSLAEARSVAALSVGATVVGLVYDAPRPVLGAGIAGLITDPERRSKVDAWRYSLINVGGGVAGGVGGLFAGWWGTPALYRINGVACAAFAAVAICGMPSSPRPTARIEKFGYRQAFSDTRLVLLFVSSLATLTAFMGLLAVMPMLMIACGLPASAYGQTQAANAVAVIAMTPLVTPWVSRRLHQKPRADILAAAAAWTAFCMGAGALASTTTGFAMAAIACAPGEIAWFVVGADIVHRIAPAAHPGRYHGVWSMTTAVAAVVAPFLASSSLIHGGRLLVAAATLAVGLIGTALCWPLARALALRPLLHPEMNPVRRAMFAEPARLVAQQQPIQGGP